MKDLADACEEAVLQIDDLLGKKTNVAVQLFPSGIFSPNGSEVILPSKESLQVGYHWLPTFMSPVRAYKLDKTTYSVRGYLIKDNAAVSGGNIYPHHVYQETMNKLDTVGKACHGDSSFERCFILLHANFTTYGHFLLEMLPKLAVYQALSISDPSIPVLLPRGCPTFVRSWIKFLLPGCNILTQSSNQSIALSEVFLADMLITHYLASPLMLGFVKYCVASAAQRPKLSPRRILLSRRNRRLDRGDFRRLVNFDEIELKLQALGFSTIEPETMSIAEQIQIFAGAEIVVGELSSALHNAMFSPAETIVVQLNPFNSVQRHLALSMQHILISITPDDGSVRSWPGSPNLPSDFTVRPDMIEKAIQIGLNMRKG